MTSFDYQSAFSRNIGWITETEQQQLQRSRVAIAGLGGVGGVHLLTLARMGIEKFTIAEFDVFDIANFNRQIGATTETIGKPKIEVLTRMALEINPDIDLRLFPEGVSENNMNAFLEDVDVYVDGLDFFAFDARRKAFTACRDKGIPVVTAAPLGLGTAVLIFGPNSLSSEDYFGFEGCDELEMSIRFLTGLSPAMLQRSYLVDAGKVNLAEHRGPSNIAACQLCAGVAGVETLKLLLKRGDIRYAPWSSHFDAYRMRYVRIWRPGGYRNPLQWLLRALMRAKLGIS
jgi:molybdopterin/thiamine biosynthesis adenylyltransferase